MEHVFVAVLLLKMTVMMRKDARASTRGDSRRIEECAAPFISKQLPLRAVYYIVLTSNLL